MEANKFSDVVYENGAIKVFPFCVEITPEHKLWVSIAFSPKECPDGVVSFPVLGAKLENAALSLRDLVARPEEKKKLITALTK